jgi:hypothetical protein
MATEAQIEANRRNAAKSTGPRTPEGKARVRRNATRHGLCSGIALMAEEGPGMEQEFNLLLEDLREEHQPNGPTEDILVFKMAESVFFANRARALITLLLRRFRSGSTRASPDAPIPAHRPADASESLPDALAGILFCGRPQTNV